MIWRFAEKRLHLKSQGGFSSSRTRKLDYAESHEKGFFAAATQARELRQNKKSFDSHYLSFFMKKVNAKNVIKTKTMFLLLLSPTRLN